MKLAENLVRSQVAILDISDLRLSAALYAHSHEGNGLQKKAEASSNVKVMGHG